jgi:hypothetical protein
MADKTPVRVVFNESNVATGLAEFQSGETVPVANGGTGLSSIGSAGQILKVNAAGSALEFGAEGDISITNLVAPTNADLTFTTSGTGNIVLDAVTVRGTTFSAADSTKITIAEALDVTGALTFSGITLPTSDGSANQFLKTDGSGTLSFADVSLGDLTIVGSTITTPSNADFILDPSGSGKVNINGAYTLPSSDGSTGQFLKTDGSGTLSFADLSLGDLTIVGSTITTPSNADFTLNPSGSGKVNINGAYTLPSSDGSAGQVLQTDGSGAVTFGTVSVGDFTFTGSTIISPSNADITLDPSGSGEIALNANTTITGNLTVSGTQTTLETTTLVVEDPLLELAKNNSSGIANTMDQGLFFNRGSDSNVSFLWDESADEFVFAVTSGEDGTTQGNVTIDSYANIRANIVNTTGNVILGEDAVMVFEGASDNTNETTLTVVDPTADRTISLPNKSGTLATTEDTSFPESTTPTHPAASGDADLGDLTTSITDAFSVPTADLYDQMEPRGSTTSVDLGSVAS